VRTAPHAGAVHDAEDLVPPSTARFSERASFSQKCHLPRSSPVFRVRAAADALII
jgi:hypothetical protein